MAKQPRATDSGDVSLLTERSLTGDERIVHEAKRRFRRVAEWEQSARTKYIDDIKFAAGDAENLWQWPDSVRQSRGIGTRDERPCLTINKTNQHCLQIENDARQNKTSIHIHPTGNEATYEAAQVLEGIVRHIEYISDAQSAYTTATKFQVRGGIGYWRVVTDYADSETFDQEIYIRRIKDPLTVYVDPDFQEADGSDMRFAFIYTDIPEDEFRESYPQYADRMPASPLGGISDDWRNQEHIRVAEYFRAVPNEDRILAITDPGTGRVTTVKASTLPKELRDTAIDNPTTKWRTINDTKIEWYLIIGETIAERRDWPGKYIPLVRCPGEETVIEGQLDRKGHVRALKDPQRMYNFHASSEVEFVALQSKSPYIAPVKAIEGLETYWETLNLVNPSVLPFNHLDDDGNEVPAPERSAPPQASQAYLLGMQTAANDMMLVSGQYQADFGAPSNERSGVAIQQRQRQGENATYHYIDHLAMAIRYTGKIILDLIPKIYDTPRVIKIMAEDGKPSDIQIDPSAAVAYQKKQLQTAQTVQQVIFNPSIGRYDVEADVGPSFGTRREEAFNAYSQIMQGNPELVKIAGDLMFKAADFPYADALAERLEKTLPPELRDDAPSPQLLQAQQQLQAMQQLLAVLGQKLADKGAEEAHKTDEATIRAYEAVTKRLDMLFERLGAPADAQAAEREALQAGHETELNMIADTHRASLAALAPQPEPAGAQAA